jgi:hypothetical protein
LVPKHPAALCAKHRGGFAEFKLSFSRRAFIERLALGTWTRLVQISQRKGAASMF